MKRFPLHDGWQFREKVNPFAELAGSAGPYQDVRLPHDATIGRARTPGGHPATACFPGGVYQYRRALTLPQGSEGQRAVLEFEGVYRDAMVYVNGAFAGQNRHGYTGFTVDATQFLVPGENRVSVEARSHLDSRWYSGAGIYRPVWLWTGAPVRIAFDGVRVTTPDIDSGRAVAEVAVTIENDTATLRTSVLRVRLTGPGGEVAASGETPVSVRARCAAVARMRYVVAGPALWSPGDPSLYAAEAELVVDGSVTDTARASFGIRRLQLDPEQGLRINGEPVKLRGACVHHDNGILGAATFAAAEERRVRLLRRAGFNAIRSAHNPASKALLEACDRHGMLVMDELSDVWVTGKTGFDYSLDFPQAWERDVEAMIAKDYNHPSVICYSIGNEIPEAGTPAGAALGREIAEKVRGVDSTRFVTNGINPMLAVMDEFRKMTAEHRGPAGEGAGINTLMNQVGEVMARVSASPAATERTAESLGMLDVAGLNYAHARYELDRELFPNRVIVGTETAPPQVDRLWRLVLDNPHVIGDFTWTGWDYLGEAGAGRVQYLADGELPAFEAGYPWITAWMGDLDITGVRRPASYYREIVFGLRGDPYIAVQRPERYGSTPVLGQWSWTDSVASWTWPGFEGRPVVVEVYSDADEVELLLDGRRVGRAPAGEAQRFRASFELAYQPGELTAVAWRGGRPAERTSLASAAGALSLVATAEAAVIPGDGSDIGFVALALADGSGTVATGFDEPVTVTVTGPGELAAFGSGRPCTEESYHASAHSTFDGRALAAIRATGHGEIRVHAVTSSGLAATAVLRAN